jgi:hypothetical protein
MDEVDAVLELILINPKLYPNSQYKSLRKAVIKHQITLFYKLTENEIYLVRFWNNFKNPDSFDFN